MNVFMCVIIKLDQHLEEKSEHINKSMKIVLHLNPHTRAYTRVLLTVSQFKHFFLCLIFLNEILFHAATFFPPAT